MGMGLPLLAEHALRGEGLRERGPRDRAAAHPADDHDLDPVAQDPNVVATVLPAALEALPAVGIEGLVSRHGATSRAGPGRGRPGRRRSARAPAGRWSRPTSP